MLTLINLPLINCFLEAQNIYIQKLVLSNTFLNQYYRLSLAIKNLTSQEVKNGIKI